MTQTGTWVSYGGAAEIVLAGGLMVTAATVFYAGLRRRQPARLPRPGRKVSILALAAWPLAFAAIPVCVGLYVAHALREHVAVAPPADPITPFTLIGTGIIFCVIALACNSRGWRVALPSAVLGAVAGPVIFEFPFDLIVMARIYPGLPPDPALYRALFFAPLLLVEILTLAILTLSPVARLSRATLWCLASMLAVFGVWALWGFGYPSTPATTTLNVVAKILALLAALTLFVPARAEPSTESSARPARAKASAVAWTGVM
jgi:hypothetical protein